MAERSTTFNAIQLCALAAAAAILLTLVHAATRTAIAANEVAARQRTMWEVIPGPHDDLNLVVMPVPNHYRTLLGLAAQGGELYLVRRQQTPIAAIIPVIAQGYGGAIVLAVGVDLRGTVTGVRVLAHRETPGLGDDIELGKSRWILGFNGKSRTEPPDQAWRIKKDGGQFDGFIGATITPRAVVHGVHQALRYLAEDGGRLLAAKPEPHPRRGGETHE